MPQFSDKSAAALATAHPMLQRLMNSAIAESNFTVLVGHRGQAAQTEAYEKGASKLQWPNSKHTLCGDSPEWQGAGDTRFMKPGPIQGWCWCTVRV